MIRIAVVGKIGSGKSFVANSMLEFPLFADADPFILILGNTPKTPTFSFLIINAFNIVLKR